MKIIKETERLILRGWKEEDKNIYFEISSDPKVMEFYPDFFSRTKSDAFVDKAITYLDEKGFTLYALEDKETGKLIGSTGLAIVEFKAAFTPCMEIGWRLCIDYWGRGLAVEAAKAALEIAFNEFQRKEVVAFTSKLNFNSIRVMEKLGMTRDPSLDFHHPNVPEGHELREHVLYRIKKSEI